VQSNLSLYKETNFNWVHSTLLNDRIDAKNYKVEYLELQRKIISQTYIRLRDVIEDIKNGFEVNRSYSDVGLKFLTVKDLKEFEINYSDIKKIDLHFRDIPEKGRLKEGDIIITRSGSIGIAKTITNNDEDIVISSDIIKLRVNNKIDRDYLTTYLNSDTGRKLIEQLSYGAVIKKIGQEELLDLLIPIPSPEIQKYIGDKVRKAEELREEAKRLKKEVLDRLNTLLFNPNIKIDNNKFLYLDCKEIIDYKIGATIYRPKYVSNRRGLKQGIKLLKLKDISRKIYDGNHGSVHPKNILDEGDIPFIRAQDAHDGLVEINKYISNEEYRLLKHKTINYGDIVYGIKGSVGKGGIYLYENSDATVNPACVVISPKKLVNSGYLIEVLESDYFNNEIYRFAESDSTRPQISRTEFEELEVPMVSEEEQKAIGDLVFRRIKAINQSKQLIQEAKQDVEDLIEGNFDMSKVKANS